MLFYFFRDYYIPRKKSALPTLFPWAMRGFLCFCSLLLLATPVAAHSIPPQLGINLSGAEFGKSRHRYGHDYLYPPPGDLDFYRVRGVTLVRLPFRWERIQPTLYGPLDAVELGRLRIFLVAARVRGMQVILDLHNYGRYRGKVLGSPEVPTDALADVWCRLAVALASEPAVIGYGLMNEPHDMGDPKRWPTAAQAAVDAIRTVDRRTAILVAGDNWSGAWKWKQSNANLRIHDPADNLYYEAHQYFDRDGSGRYRGGYDGERAHPDLAERRLRPFLEWLQETGARGFVGELAVPGDDPRWTAVLERAVQLLRAHGVGVAYWGGGSRWGNYPLAPVDRFGTPRPQLGVIERYASEDRRQDQRPEAEAQRPGRYPGDHLGAPVRTGRSRHDPVGRSR